MRFRPTPSMFVSIVAVVIACAGSATAASLITGAQVRNGSLTGRDVKDHSLTARDFRGSVRGPRGHRGPQGEQGVQGPQGATGAPTTVSLTRVAQAREVAAGESSKGYALCPAGSLVTGGGYRFTDGTAPVGYSEDGAGAGGVRGWFVGVDNSSSRTPVSVEVVAFCLASR